MLSTYANTVNGSESNIAKYRRNWTLGTKWCAMWLMVMNTNIWTVVDYDDECTSVLIIPFKNAISTMMRWMRLDERPIRSRVVLFVVAAVCC